MLAHSLILFIRSGRSSLKFGSHFRPSKGKFKQLERYTRNAANVNKFAQSPSRRIPQHARFNPESVLHTKAETGESMKWWHHQRLVLPNIPPEDWEHPTPIGSRVWPKGWDDDHAAQMHALYDGGMKHHVLAAVQRVVHEEVVKDGYDLREVDFEGKPTTELPQMDRINEFILEEETIRARVFNRVLDEIYRIPTLSRVRDRIRSIETLACFVEDFILQTKTKPSLAVPKKVEAFIESQSVKPSFGFEFVLPHTHRGRMEQAWENLFIHNWQFGKAVYTPQSKEESRGNILWARLSKDWEDRMKHEKRNIPGSIDFGTN